MPKEGEAVRCSILGALEGASRLALLVFPLVAAAGVSETEYRRYLASDPSPATYTEDINPLIELLRRSPRAMSPTAAINRIVRDWHLPASAAEGVLELIVLSGASARDRKQIQALKARRQRAASTVVDLGGEFPEAWHVILWYLHDSGQCSDRNFQDRYFKNPWAASDFVRRPSSDCEEWRFLVPQFAIPSALLYGRIAEGSHSQLDTTVALWAFRDALIREGVEFTRPARLFAERRYWLELYGLGLDDAVLAEARLRSAQELEVMLSGPKSSDAVVIDGAEVEGAGFANSIAGNLQQAWIGALLAAGRREEAADWVRRWHWDSNTPSPGDAGTPPNADPDAIELKTRAALVQMVESDRELDAFDAFVATGLFSEHPFSTVAGERFAIGLMEDHGYSEIATYIRERSCDYRDREEPDLWHEFPTEVRSFRAALAARITSLRAQRTCGTADTEPHSAPSAGRAWVEHPVPTARRSPGPKPNRPTVPAIAKAALAPFDIVRYSGSGAKAAAISVSQDVDPVGEVSGGGYWLHLSDDRGRTWRGPYYLGLQQFEPYVVVSRSRIPLIRDGVLEVEVEVRELDPDSITFPPIGLRTRRTAKNLYLSMPLDNIERDSDGDGLTDLLEDKLQTNPRDVDTDHDGIWDDVDPLPQVSAKGAPIADVEVLKLTLTGIFGYDEAAIGTGGQTAGDDAALDVVSAIARTAKRHPASARQHVLFLQADEGLFHGISVPGHIVIVTAEQSRAIREKYGLFYPVKLGLWFNHAHTKAVVNWSAGWVGGTLRFQKVEGRWLPPEREGWIT